MGKLSETFKNNKHLIIGILISIAFVLSVITHIIIDYGVANTKRITDSRHVNACHDACFHFYKSDKPYPTDNVPIATDVLEVNKKEHFLKCKCLMINVAYDKIIRVPFTLPGVY